MCGINGFNFKNLKIIKDMNKSIKHRGPDDEGIFASEEMTLGQVRLAILDLTDAGHQPMFYNKKIGSYSEKHNSKFLENDNLSIVFNGEIYNYQDIRKELETKDYIFSSKCDTEVILAAYLEYGFDCVKKFNGMWAFCIYDKVKKILFISRDRLGVKPLYYYFNEGKFIFSSEIKGILAHEIYKKIDIESIDFYFSLGFIPSPKSIFENIYKLEARENLIFDLDKKSIKKYYYYKIPKYSPSYDKDKLIEKSKSILNDATNIRMIADVPVGAFLSGGLDSSSVVYSMSSFTDLKSLHTFSIGFEGKYDETYYMKIVKNHLKTNHHHNYYKKENFENEIDKLSYYFDEPFADFSNFPTFHVSSMAKDYVTVCLSGDGGDEIFGGYGTHKIAYQIESLRKIPKFLRKILSLIKFKNINEGVRLSLLKNEEFYSEFDKKIYIPLIVKKWSSEKMKIVLESCDNNFAEAIIRYDLFYNTLSDNYLTKVDRASMANALEVRSPFLDYRFVELESKIPIEWKVDNFHTKKIMKEIIKNNLPEEIVNRYKQGFIPPLIEWIKKEKYVDYKKSLDILYNQKIINDEWFNFYNNIVLKENNFKNDIYKIRLILFMKWYKRWVKL